MLYKLNIFPIVILVDISNIKYVRTSHKKINYAYDFIIEKKKHLILSIHKKKELYEYICVYKDRLENGGKKIVIDYEI